MTIEILSFPTSFLNPLLKLLVIILFASGTVIFYQAYTSYGGNLKKISFFLMGGGIAATLAGVFRLMGDFFIQWKWGESTFLLIFAFTSILAAFVIDSYLLEIAIIFGMGGEEE